MAHGALLRQHSDDPELASHVMQDFSQADLDPQTKGMLEYAAKLTKNPTSMEKSDVETELLVTQICPFLSKLFEHIG